MSNLVNADLSLFNAVSVLFQDSKPRMLDSAKLNLSEEEIATEKEIIVWTFKVTEEEGINYVEITSLINIPCWILDNNPIFKGTYYRYENLSKYKVNKEVIEPIVVAEIAHLHLSRVISGILIEIQHKNPSYTISYPCMAKLILHAE